MRKGLCEIDILIIVSLVAIVCLLVSAPIAAWTRAGIESKMYNQKFGTSYTQHDFFWSGDTVKLFLNGGVQSTQNINFKCATPVKLEQ